MCVVTYALVLHPKRFHSASLLMHTNFNATRGPHQENSEVGCCKSLNEDRSWHFWGQSVTVTSVHPEQVKIGTLKYEKNDFTLTVDKKVWVIARRKKNFQLQKCTCALQF